MPAKAIVADDHPLFRSALKHAVLSVLGDNILESSSFDETLDLLNIHQNIDFFLNTHAGSKPGFELAPKLVLRGN